MLEYIIGFAIGAIFVMVLYEIFIVPCRIAKEVEKEREQMLLESYDILVEKLKEVWD